MAIMAMAMEEEKINTKKIIAIMKMMTEEMAGTGRIEETGMMINTFWFQQQGGVVEIYTKQKMVF